MNTAQMRLNIIFHTGLFFLWELEMKQRKGFPGMDSQCTHNVPHTAPLGVIIEYVVLGRRALGGA